MNKAIPIYFALTNSKIIKDNGDILSQNELLQFWNFLNMLIGSRSCTFIMRGDSNENLMKQYYCDTNSPKLLAQYIFMVGEKGRICWSKKKYYDPDDTSLSNFQSICELLNRFINEGCSKGNIERMQKMQNFVLRNKEFCKDIKNINDIVKRYGQLKTEDRIRVNLYYLSIAHTINSYKYQKVSNFISTTTNLQVATTFTDDICIYGWIPTYGWNRIKSIDYIIASNKSFIEKLKIPYCDTPVYPEQKEILLRCGLLPHFIIGFKSKNNFYTNPAIFSLINDMGNISSFKDLCRFKSNFIRNGLNIDQTNFENFCHETNFKRYYSYDGEIYKLHDLY